MLFGRWCVCVCQVHGTTDGVAAHDGRHVRLLSERAAVHDDPAPFRAPRGRIHRATARRHAAQTGVRRQLPRRRHDARWGRHTGFRQYTTTSPNRITLTI